MEENATGFSDEQSVATITFRSSAGQGISERVQLTPGETLKEIFYRMMGSEAQPSQFKIFLNDTMRPEGSTVLKDGDCVTVGPLKQAGA